MSPANSAKPDRRPPYQHAADAIRREIRAGRYKPGEQLPSYRELQERFGIANMTARSALNVLRDEGLVYTIQGRGSFVADIDESGIDYTPPAWYLAGEKREAAPPDTDTEGTGDFEIDYSPPAWYRKIQEEKAASGATPEKRGGKAGDIEFAEAIAHLIALRDEIRRLSTEHQALRREVEELKGRVRTEKEEKP
ncbi:SCO5717 family growth-regulating ATPase [Streptomyces sp. HK10]|uniref:SCO5717 family growth-regulating ATPase n=1 Tax=Streptomyces sp. HK10 TaxID=3373255 RepID=UPI003748E43B